MSKLRILLADDHAMIREGLKMLINTQPDMVCIGEAGDGAATLELTQALQPDVLVLDVSMPELSGVEVAQRLRQLCPRTKILVLTRHKDESYLQQLLSAGVVGYVLKQSVATELLRALQALAQGHTFLDPAITQDVVTAYTRKPVPGQAHTLIQLSERETEILRLVAWGYSNKEIAAQLTISVKTVETHKANAMQKLNLKSRIAIVRYALQQGWLQEGS